MSDRKERVENRRRHPRKGLQTVTAHLTGSEGPLRAAVDELSRVGIGARIVKSAIAATIAWILASFLPRENAPFVAALTAFYTIDLTIFRSLTSAGQRFAGITVGIAMAFLAAEFLGVHAWTVGLVILLSMVVGIRLNLKPEGLSQVAGTAIIVLVVRSTTEERSLYAVTFLADTLMGSVVGLAVNSLLFPPDYLPGVRRTLDLAIARVTDVLDSLATMVVDGFSLDETNLLDTAIRQVSDDLGEVESSLEQATEALRFNIMAAEQRVRLGHFQSVQRRLSEAVRALEFTVHALGRAVGQPWMGDPVVTERLADLVSSCSQVLQAQGPSESRAQADAPLLADVQEQMTALQRMAAEMPLSPHLWAVVGSATALAEETITLNRNEETSRSD